MSGETLLAHLADDERYMLAELSFEECSQCGGTGCADCKNEGVLPVWEQVQ